MSLYFNSDIMNAENVAKKGQNILNEAAAKPKTECPILSRYFFCNVIVIGKDNRHFVIVCSENVISAKVRWSDKSFLED